MLLIQDFVSLHSIMRNFVNHFVQGKIQHLADENQHDDSIEHTRMIMHLLL